MEATIVVSAISTVFKKGKEVVRRITGNSRKKILQELAPLKGQHENSPFYIDRLDRYRNVRPTKEAVAHNEQKILKLLAMLADEESPIRRQTVYGELGDTCGQIGKLEEARHAYEEADRIAEEINAYL